MDTCVRTWRGAGRSAGDNDRIGCARITIRLRKKFVIQGEYGVFHAGAAVSRLKEAKGKSMRERQLEEVNPLKTFVLQWEVYLSGAQTVELLIQTPAGEHLLDQYRPDL